MTVSARSAAWAVAALVMTVSGVFSAWARLPAWRRASSACSSLWASSSLISSTSGWTSLGKFLGDAGLRAATGSRDLAPHAAQRPQAVEGLQRGQHEQAEPERGEAPDQGRAQVRGSGRRSPRATARPGSASGRRIPAGSRRARAMRSGSPANSQLSSRVQLDVVVARRRRAAADPTASATGRCPAPCAADLEIDTRIGLEEALVGRRPVEADLAVGPDFRRGDHRVEDIFELLVEILRRSTRDSTRSSAKPPISSSTLIQTAATPIMRRVSDPPRRSADLHRRRHGGGGHRSSAGHPRGCSRGRGWW